MEENKVRNAEFQAEAEKLKEELKAKLKMQREQEEIEKEKQEEQKREEQKREEQKLEECTKEQVVQEALEDAGPKEPEEIEQPEDVPDSSEEEKRRWKKRIYNLIYDFLIVVGVGLLLFSAYSIYKDYTESKESQESYEKIKNEYVKVPDDKLEIPTGDDIGTAGQEQPKEWYEQIWVDLEGLQTQVNEDIVGWIYFENEDISYPILYSTDNNEYDRVRYDLVYAMCGSITLEATNKWDFSDIRNIIYGHNMRDLSMFGKLKYYKNEGYYQDHQYFQLIYDGMIYRYQIFSYFDVEETEVSYIRVDYDENNTYEAMLGKLQSNAMHETGVEVTAEDKTVTLLTCADDKTKRFLVNAVLVDEHVMPNEDGTYPDTEPETEEPDTDTETEEPETEEPDTEPDDRFEQEYTYTEINQTMWATTGVKIRNQPSADSVRMGYLAKGQGVQVLARCNENGWYRVQLRKGVGYVNGNYLTDVNPHVHTEVPGGTADAHSKCESCGAVLSTEHVFVDEVVTEATAATAGVMKHTCACGYSYTSEIPPKTEEPSEPTEEPSEPTEEPSEPTEEPSEPTEEPSEPTEEPSEPTEEPSEPTEEPSEPTEEPSEPTEEPTESTEESGEPTEAPDETTEELSE